MLAKTNRLPIGTDTKNYLSYSASFFSVKTGKNKTEKSRFAFIVAKSIDKRATVRNRLRRQFRQFVQEETVIKKGYDFLFKIKKEASGKKTKEIHSQIRQLFEKEGLIE
jgi:ribonuclease P protein component